ncbi:hypothetical protein [Neoroseomonas rubea]|uniref:hypothetical protein n=1 Tax=Neoroseomonas rubea TaxID=2748666 RepID=UPI0018E01985|nr:hypothetical protein [Roseomonas rubea]
MRLSRRAFLITPAALAAAPAALAAAPAAAQPLAPEAASAWAIEPIDEIVRLRSIADDDAFWQALHEAIAKIDWSFLRRHRSRRYGPDAA